MLNPVNFVITVLTFASLCNYSFESSFNPIIDNHRFAVQFFKYFHQSNVSDNCRKTAEYYKKHSDADWAIQFVDSSGAIPAGVIRGNFQYLGDFDECLEISVQTNHDIDTISDFHGQYCTLTLPIEAVLGSNYNASSGIDFKQLGLNPTIGVCLPSSCTENDVNRILKTYSNNTGVNVDINQCTDRKYTKVETYHIGIIIGFGMIILLLIMGTLIDYGNHCNITLLQNNNSTMSRCLISFSIYNNTIKLFQKDKGKDTIECFHGFRLISILFIILYHAYTEAQLPSANLLEILKSEQNFLLQIVTNAGLWVEAFFLLSGFLVAYGTIRECQRTSIKNFNPLLKYVHRYFRLTPSLIAIIAFSILQEIFGSGPMWYQYVENSRQTCHKSWWINLLYVNNIFRLNQLGSPPTECVTFTWYLAVDMQLFLISPLLILLLAAQSSKVQKIGVGLNIGVIILSWVITGIIMNNDGLTPTVVVTIYDLNYINKIYKQSYCRIGPYCVGILFAYYYLRFKGTFKIKRVHNVIYWCISIGVNLAMTFLTWPWLTGGDYRNIPSVIYGSTHRTIWALTWAYMLFSCANGYGGLINSALSCGILTPLSRLSFQVYLLHSVIMARFVQSARTPIYSSNLNLIVMFLNYSFLTFLLSYVFALAFEIPFINLERIIFHKSQPKPKPKAKRKTSDKNEDNDTAA